MNGALKRWFRYDFQLAFITVEIHRVLTTCLSQVRQIFTQIIGQNKVYEQKDVQDKTAHGEKAVN